MASKVSAIKGSSFVASFCFPIYLSLYYQKISSFSSHFKRLLIVEENFEWIWTRQKGNVIHKPPHQRIILFLIWQLNRVYIEWLSKPNATLSYELSCKSILLHGALLQVNPRHLSYPLNQNFALWSSCFLANYCSLHVTMHINPLARHWQLGSSQTEVQLQDNNYMMTPGVSDPVIQQFVSSPSS